jgi:hypothetical protein
MYDLSLRRWHDQFKCGGLTASLRLALRETLRPCVSLRAPSRCPGADDGNKAQDHIKNIVEWKIVLVSNDVHSDLRDLSRDKRWMAVMPKLLDDFNALLRDVLDLMRDLGGSDSKNDLSRLHQP